MLILHIMTLTLYIITVHYSISVIRSYIHTIALTLMWSGLPLGWTLSGTPAWAWRILWAGKSDREGSSRCIRREDMVSLFYRKSSSGDMDSDAAYKNTWAWVGYLLVKKTSSLIMLLPQNVTHTIKSWLWALKTGILLFLFATKLCEVARIVYMS